jgi:serine protease Do
MDVLNQITGNADRVHCSSRQKLKPLVILTASVCMSAFALNGSAATETEVIERVTNASVLIRTELLHGFTEDKIASGRWRGSGFVIDKAKGWIMTNAHVSGSGPANLRVEFAQDDQKFDATRVFVDSRHDIAVIQVDPKDIPADSEELALDCEFDLKRGTRLVAVGHPHDHEFSVTLGVLSGLKTFGADPDLFSTDVVVESGSSGGPVVSIETGRVIGVATSKYKESDIGLLTKSSDACHIYDLLQAGLDPSRPKLGFQLLFKDSELSAEVGQILVEGSALKLGDEIVEVVGKPWDPEEDGELEDSLRSFQEKQIALTVSRDGSMVQVSVPNEKIGSLHARDWVHFSGLTFAVSKHQDSPYRNGGAETVIRVQSVDDGYDDTSELAFEAYGLLRSIDGLEFQTLRAMYDYLVNQDGKKVGVVVRAYDMTHEWVAFPFHHLITVEDLKSSFD